MLQAACQDADALQLIPKPLRLLAPLWHTQVLVGLMLLVAITGTVSGPAIQPAATTASLVWSVCVPLIVVNLGLAVYVCRVGLRSSVLAELLSEGRYDKRRLLGDLATAAGLALLLILAEGGFQRLLGVPESAASHALLPNTGFEKFSWLFGAGLIGFSEELVYRGYLQRQLAALSGHVPLGVVAQALLFGIAHGEQGAWAVARFAAYALGLGWVAVTRRSLWPTILCHAAIDGYAAFNV